MLRFEAGTAPQIVTRDTEDGWLPTGVASKDGTLWVLEHHESLTSGPRVRRIDVRGGPKVIGVVDDSVLGGNDSRPRPAQ